MVLDTSALVAILLAEEESNRMVAAIARDGTRIIGAPTWVEATAVMLSRRGSGGEIALDALVARLGIEVAELTVDAARLSRLGYARFGKGVGDPGVLKYGDTLTYGVAMAAGEPLLFKGDDFRHTDVERVEY